VHEAGDVREGALAPFVIEPAEVDRIDLLGRVNDGQACSSAALRCRFQLPHIGIWRWYCRVSTAATLAVHEPPVRGSARWEVL
jgi:hypothetical protein